MTTPYAAAAMAYLDRGWSPIPLPPSDKAPPPEGFTGKRGEYPSRATVGGWIAEGVYHTKNKDTGALVPHKVGNVGLRLAPNVLGIDVDHYGEKTGGDSIAAAEVELGALPPTWISTSRPETLSGIRLYRVPEGLAWHGLAHVDALHKGWRYAVVAPSRHPQGRPYVWIDPHGTVYDTAADAPTPDELPELPPAWVEYLSRPATTRGTAGPVDIATVAQALDAMPTGTPCEHMAKAAGKALVTQGARHDSYLGATLAILRYGRLGCPGASATLHRLREAFIAEVTGDGGMRRTDGEAAREWRGFFTGAAVGDVLADPQGTHCTALIPAYLDSLAEAHRPDTDSPDADSPEVARRMQILAKADELRILAEARELVAAEKAAATFDPPPVQSLPQLIAATEAHAVRWRWRDLCEIGDRFLLEAGAKTGKTTLLANAVRALLTGEPLLDHFATTPLDPHEVILYVDTELGPRRLSRWLGDVLDADQRQRVIVWSLAGRAGSLDVRDTDTRNRMAEQVRASLDGRAVGMVIVDVAAAWTAPLGIDENGNPEVRAFLESLHTFALDIDAGGLILAHHTGHVAERSRGASAFRDWPDVYATLTKGTADGDTETRYFAANGRDVHVAESRLHFDPDTRRLSLTDGVGLSRAAAARQRAALAYADTVATVVAETPGMNTKALRAAVAESLRAEGVSVKAAAIGEAVTLAADTGRIVDTGTAKARNWQPPQGVPNESGPPRDHPSTQGPEITEGVPGVSQVVPRVSPGGPKEEGTGGGLVSRPLIQAGTHQQHPDERAEQGEPLPWEVAL